MPYVISNEKNGIGKETKRNGSPNGIKYILMWFALFYALCMFHNIFLLINTEVLNNETLTCELWMVIYCLLNSFFLFCSFAFVFFSTAFHLLTLSTNKKSESSLIKMNYISDINSFHNEIHKMFQTSNNEYQIMDF